MNGNGKIEELLERIAANTDGLNERVDGLNGRVDALNRRQDAIVKAVADLAVGQEQTRVELVQIRTDMNRGFAQVNARIDNVLGIAGSHHDDHEQRIRVLEERVLGGSK